jgi:hypothetical protein
MTIRFRHRRAAPSLYCITVHATDDTPTAQFLAVIDKGINGLWRLYRPVPPTDYAHETQHLYFRTRREAIRYVALMGL